MVNTAP